MAANEPNPVHCHPLENIMQVSMQDWFNVQNMIANGTDYVSTTCGKYIIENDVQGRRLLVLDVNISDKNSRALDGLKIIYTIKY